MRIWVPGTPGTPGTPATISETNKTGWSSGAVSIPILSGNGGYEFFVPASVVGVVCGLADHFAGIGYRSIDHALYFTRGSFSLMEFGATVQELGTYGSSDKFVMWRQGADVFVSQNGVLIARRPSTLDASFRLASSMYLKGDTIVNAKVAAIIAGVGTAEGGFGPISALGMEGAGNFGVGVIGPFDVLAGAANHARAAGKLDGVRALASNKHYAAGAGSIGSFSSYAEGGVSAPSWALGDGYLTAASTHGHSFTGAVATGSANLRRVQARGSDHVYGSGEGELGEVFAFGAQAVDISLGLLTITTAFSIRGEGTELPIEGLVADLPALTMVGAFGGQGLIDAPAVTLSATGVFMPVLRGDVVLPSLQLEATGSTGGVGSAELHLTGRYGVSLLSGAQADLVGPGLDITAGGSTGGVAVANLAVLGRYALEAGGDVHERVVWEITGPSLQPAPSGQAWLVAPSLTLVAHGEEVVVVSREAYAINLATGAVTEYKNFAFENVLRFGDRFFGVQNDGIYELTGDTDNGEPIIAKVRTFYTDFGKTNIKRVPFVYVVGETGTDLQIGFTADKGVEYEYPVGLVSTQGVQTGRARAGLGVKGTYYNFSITNTEGQAFQIDRLEAIVDSTTVVKG